MKPDKIYIQFSIIVAAIPLQISRKGFADWLRSYRYLSRRCGWNSRIIRLPHPHAYGITFEGYSDPIVEFWIARA